MIEVTKAQFYGAIAGPENIHPRPERTEVIWENQQTRQQVGRSEPGYVDPGATKRFFLTTDFAARKGIRL